MNDVTKPQRGDPGFDLIDRRQVVSRQGAGVTVTRIFLTEKGKKMLTTQSRGIRVRGRVKEDDSIDEAVPAG